MVRSAVALIVGFILLCLESLLVAKLKNVQSIEFGGIGPFIGVWAMNFFMVFCILTQIKMWFDEKEEMKEES